jgi:hypothetical protein
MNVKVDTDDYKIKNALDGAKGSLQAVIDFLSKNGVAKARYVPVRTNAFMLSFMLPPRYLLYDFTIAR